MEYVYGLAWWLDLILSFNTIGFVVLVALFSYMVFNSPRNTK